MSAKAVVDSMVFHDWGSPLTLTPYMSEGYRSWVENSTDVGGPAPLRSYWLYQHPRGRRAANSYGQWAGSGSEFETFEATILDPGLRERVVLGYDDGILSSSYAKPYAARAAVRAANDWTAEQWLARDKRLFGLILISSAMPEEAAAEIRRVGVDDRMVGVAFGANALGRPFGDPLYHPIYQAAAELDLPIVLQVGSDAATEMAPPIAGGLPATYGEYHALGAQSLMTHAASLIVESVFDVFPNLKVLLIGGGATWVPAYLWRLDYWYKMAPTEAPWIRRLPSEYFVEHFRIGTYSLESFDPPERLAQALSTVPGIESMLVYASGSPSSDAEEPASIAERLPPSWHDGVFRANADLLFRWPGRSRVARAPAVSEAEFHDMPGASRPPQARLS
jgi:uncharacterized protein